MSDEEMKNIWNKAGDGDRIKLDFAKLLDSLKAKMKSMDRRLILRDGGEIGAALFLMIYFGYQSFIEKVPVLLVVNVLIVIWSIYVIYRLLDVRKYKKIAELSSSLKAQLAQQKMYLQKQAHLLDTAWAWYVAPPTILYILSTVSHNYSGGFNLQSMLYSFTFITIISVGLAVWNKRAAKSTYGPLIENIDRVLVELEAE